MPSTLVGQEVSGTIDGGVFEQLLMIVSHVTAHSC